VRTKFNAMLAPLDSPTGDERRFASSGIELAPTPFPFEWVRERQGGHDGAVSIGVVQEAAITTVDKAVEKGWISESAAKTAKLDGDMKAVWARGELFDDADREELKRLADDVAESMFLIGEGTLGPSVDLDSFEGIPVLEGSDEPLTFEEFERVTEETGKEPKIELLVTKGRVRAATLVSIPAFLETSRPLELVKSDDGDASLVASVTGSTDLPIADRAAAWDGPAAARRVFEHYTDGDNVDTKSVARAFLYRDPDADSATQAAYKLGFADVVDGELKIIPRGVAACAGGRGVDATKGVPDSEKATIKNKVCSLYSKIKKEYEDWPDCPFSSDDGEAASKTTASLVASVAVTELPRAELFDTPALDRPTPITIDPETGRVFGHVATWRTCHTGFDDVCVTAPRDPGGGYAWFNRHPIDTSDGLVWAGRLTAGGRHPELSLTASATMSAYDNKVTAAYVRASEDDHGIVVSGVLAPDLDDATMRTLARRKVSCDWRETSAGLSLVELLALSHGPRQYSEPGFPVAAYSNRGRQTALTASLGPSPDATPPDVSAQVRDALRSERARNRASMELALALGRRGCWPVPVKTEE
jgi:hypothetical protein